MLSERNNLKVTHLALNQEPFIRKISIYQIPDTHFNYASNLGVKIKLYSLKDQFSKHSLYSEI